MFSGPPLPLPSDLPLSFLLAHLRPPETLGAWVRGSAHELRLHDTSRGGGCSVLISADLGFLLGRCGRVALREGNDPVVLEVDRIIQWRTLQVLTGTPFLPGLERLKMQFPDLQLDPTGLSIPIPGRSPEEVLAECLASGMQVTESRIVYLPSGRVESS